MKSRAERDQTFEAIKTNLFAAGTSVVKAAKAHEEMFNTSLEAIADAMELNLNDSPQLKQVLDGSEANLIYEGLLLQRQDAETRGDFAAYVEAEEQLQRMEEFEAARLERQARVLEAQVRIQAAQRILQGAADTPAPPVIPLARLLFPSLDSRSPQGAVQDAEGDSGEIWHCGEVLESRGRTGQPADCRVAAARPQGRQKRLAPDLQHSPPNCLVQPGRVGR